MASARTPPIQHSSWAFRLSWYVAAFLTIAGSHFWLIGKYGTALPYWDQWDAEGMYLIRPYLHGELKFADLLMPHNEHRIVPTRVLALALLRLNGQWDATVEMVANAVLLALTAVLISVGSQMVLPKRLHGFAVIPWILLFALPASWANTLGGFQSQFYFLLLFSLFAICGFAIAAPGSALWCASVISGVLASISMASGFFFALAVIAFEAVRFVGERSRAWRFAVNIGTCTPFVIAGLALKTNVPEHATYRAESLHAWILALGRFFAWPYTGPGILAILLQLPLAVLSVFFVTRRRTIVSDTGRSHLDLLFTVALWYALQVAVLAYARGGHALPPDSRYMDLLALGSGLNLISLIWITSHCRGRVRGVAVASLVGWCCFCGVGCMRITQHDFSAELPSRERIARINEENVRNYIATGDAARWLEGRGQFDLPYPVAARLKFILDDPQIRRVLPAVVAPELPARVKTDSGGFIDNGYYPTSGPPPRLHSWGSYTSGAGDKSEGTIAVTIERPALPYLRLFVAGYLPDRDLNLEIDSGGRLFRSIHPVEFARESWKEIDVSISGCRATTLDLVAADASTTRWFAFTTPVPLGRLSFFADLMTRSASVFFTTGAAVLLICGVGFLNARAFRRPPQHTSAVSS